MIKSKPKKEPAIPKDLPKVGKIEKAKVKKEPTPSVATLDRLYSEYIRRFQSCQLHGYGGVNCSTQLQCSHIHSRRFHSIRWNPMNSICACAAHHRWQHDHPTLSTWALEELLGRPHLESLRQMYLSGRKPTPEEKRRIAAWLREEIRRAA